MIFPPAPIISRILSTGMLTVTILGANSFAKGVLGPCLKYVGNPAVAISINDHAINNTKKEGKEVDSYIISAKKMVLK